MLFLKLKPGDKIHLIADNAEVLAKLEMASLKPLRLKILDSVAGVAIRPINHAAFYLMRGEAVLCHFRHMRFKTGVRVGCDSAPGVRIWRVRSIRP